MRVENEHYIFTFTRTTDGPANFGTLCVYQQPWGLRLLPILRIPLVAKPPNDMALLRKGEHYLEKRTH